MDDFEEASFMPGSSTAILISKQQKSRKLLKKMPSVSHHSSQLISKSSTTIKKTHGYAGGATRPVTLENTLDLNAISAPQNDCEITDASIAEESKTEEKHMIGPLLASERMDKVLRYLEKKRNKSSMKKFCYKCRKQVAEKRLRIKGRFVTRQQAFEILGITHDELKSNEII
jgi:hypothetical protein